MAGAKKDVENAGGQALAISADVADYGQIEAAAAQAEDAFGPIDVWVNVAFTSVFAPFTEIEPEEFRRVTEVSYLGFVYGTRAALARMIPRDHGTIVQVGSALGERSIPLQSAYCGAKHAINGFTSSLRTELMHERSKCTSRWCRCPRSTPRSSPGCCPGCRSTRSRCRRSTSRRSPPAGWLYAADHPGRKQYWVGASRPRRSWRTRSPPAA